MLAHTQIYFISPSSIFVISYHKLLTISRLKNSYDFFYHLTDNSLIISVLLLLHRKVIQYNSIIRSCPYSSGSITTKELRITAVQIQIG